MSTRRFSGKLDPKVNPFQENYLSEILGAAAVAWSLMRSPGRKEIEDRITFRLAGRLLNDPQFSQIPYDVVPQCWLLGMHGERLGRLDLRIKHRHSQHDYFAFESKRLHISYPGGAFSAEYSTYAGSDRMMAFVTGQYCKGLPAAGMLGYVMDGKSDKAWSGLTNRIKSQRRRLKLLEKSGFAESTLTAAVSGGVPATRLAETKHDLKTHRLRLFHLLLPRTKNKKKP